MGSTSPRLQATSKPWGAAWRGARPRKSRQIAVIENEIGALGVDGALVANSHAEAGRPAAGHREAACEGPRGAKTKLKGGPSFVVIW